MLGADKATTFCPAFGFVKAKTMRNEKSRQTHRKLTAAEREKIQQWINEPPSVELHRCLEGFQTHRWRLNLPPWLAVEVDNAAKALAKERNILLTEARGLLLTLALKNAVQTMIRAGL
jgi:hypothetical protein